MRNGGGPLVWTFYMEKGTLLGKWQLAQEGMVVGTTASGLGRIYMLLVAGETRQTDRPNALNKAMLLNLLVSSFPLRTWVCLRAQDIYLTNLLVFFIIQKQYMFIVVICQIQMIKKTCNPIIKILLHFNAPFIIYHMYRICICAHMYVQEITQ